MVTTDDQAESLFAKVLVPISPLFFTIEEYQLVILVWKKNDGANLQLTLTAN